MKKFRALIEVTTLFFEISFGKKEGFFDDVKQNFMERWAKNLNI